MSTFTRRQKVEAQQYTPSSSIDGLCDCMVRGVVHIHTDRGLIEAVNEGDWIVKEGDRIYRMHPDDFEREFETEARTCICYVG